MTIQELSAPPRHSRDDHHASGDEMSNATPVTKLEELLEQVLASLLRIEAAVRFPPVQNPTTTSHVHQFDRQGRCFCGWVILPYGGQL